MKSVWFIFLLAFLPASVIAQLKPDFFPEDFESGVQNGRCIFCKPGIRNKSRSKGLELAYSFYTQGDFEPEGRDFTPPLSSYKRFNRFLVDMKVPLVNKDNLKVLMSYRYFSEQYDLQTLGPDFPATFQALGDAPLKSNSFGIIVSKPLDETTYLAFQGKYTTNGNYSGWIDFHDRSSIYKLRGIFGVKTSRDMEWGIGLNLTRSFRRTTLIPFLIFNKNFNDRWGVESILPAVIFARYNINDKNILLAGPQYISRSYRFTTVGQNAEVLDFGLNHSEILTSVRWERQLAPWIWTNIQAGYQFNFSINFEGKTPNSPNFDVVPSNAPNFQISLFLSPPDHFMK